MNDNGYTVFDLYEDAEDGKIDLTSYLPDGARGLQRKLRVSKGTTAAKGEDLHFEGFDPIDRSREAYEILIPHTSNLTVRISRSKASAGTTRYDDFDTVTVPVGKALVVHGEFCHQVERAGRFLVFKSEGFKISWDAPRENGKCPYRGTCQASAECRRAYEDNRVARSAGR